MHLVNHLIIQYSKCVETWNVNAQLTICKINRQLQGAFITRSSDHGLCTGNPQGHNHFTLTSVVPVFSSLDNSYVRHLTAMIADSKILRRGRHGQLARWRHGTKNSGSGMWVQKRATKVLPQLKYVSYSERVNACNLLTLYYRRIRGDMIEVLYSRL